MIPRLLFAAVAAALALAGAAHAQTGAVKTQAALAAEMQYCVSQGKGPGCITAQQIQDLIVSGVPGVGAGLTAAGSSQGTCLPLTAQINQFTTVAASTGACLPPAVAGQTSIDCNAGANALSLYPASSAAIGSNGVNNPVSIPAGQCYGFSAISTALWEEWSSSGGGGGSGNVSTSGTIATGTLATWASGTTIAGTLAYGTTGTNTVLETGSGGTIAPSVCPAGTTGAIGCLEVGGGLSVAAGVVQLGLLTPPAHEWFSSVSSAGVLTPTQPGYADLSGAPASGDLILSGGSLGAVSGLAPSTNGDCAVVTTGAWALGSCGSGGSTTITLAPGLGNSETTFNGTSTAQTVTNASTLFPQLASIPEAANYTLNARCTASVLCDTAALVLADGSASIAFTAPNPAGTLAPYTMGDETGHGFSLTTVGGTATFFGCVSASPTSVTVPANFSIQIADQGSSANSYFCVLQAQNQGTAAQYNIGTSGGTLGLLNGANTYSGSNTFSGNLTMSGLATGTQVSCLGLTSANAVVPATGACGSGSGGGAALGDYLVGNWYSFIGPGHAAASGGAQSANTVVCEGMQVLEKATFSTLGAVVSTADSGGNLQLAIYNSASGRPSTLVGATASISETTGGAVSGAISGGNKQLAQGFYWLCINQDNSSGGWAYIDANATEPLVGSATESDVLNDNYTTFNGISGSLTFNSWTSLTSESWSNFSYAPIAGAKVYSVP